MGSSAWGCTLQQEISSARRRKHADVRDGDMQMPAIMQKSQMRHNMLRRPRRAARGYEN